MYVLMPHTSQECIIQKLHIDGETTPILDKRILNLLCPVKPPVVTLLLFLGSPMYGCSFNIIDKLFYDVDSML